MNAGRRGTVAAAPRCAPTQATRPGGARRADDVVAPVHDRARNAAEPVRVPDQLVRLQPSVVHEIVILDPREGEGEVRVFEPGAQVEIR